MLPDPRADIWCIRGGAQVWGKDDDGGGLAFKQQDIDMVVKVAGTNLLMWPMTEQSGQIILNLSISDINKELLLNAEGLIPLLVSSLLLHQDSDNPRRQQPNFHAIAPMVQRVSDVARLCTFNCSLLRACCPAATASRATAPRHTPPSVSAQN